MTFSKPRSFVSPPFKQQYRERSYPYIINKRKAFQYDGQCEACTKAAEHIIDYYMNKASSEPSVIFLCGDHEKLTRYGKWDQVLRDMDRKCDRGIK